MHKALTPPLFLWFMVGEKTKALKPRLRQRLCQGHIEKNMSPCIYTQKGHQALTLKGACCDIFFLHKEASLS